MRRWLIAGAVVFSAALSTPLLALEFSVAEWSGAAQCVRESRTIGTKHCVTYVRVGSVGKLTYAETPPDWAATLVVKFPEGTHERGVHGAIVDGDYDTDLAVIAELVQEADRPITLRVMPEMNSWWNPDAAYFASNQSPATFVAAYNYVVDYFQAVLPPSLIRDLEFNLNFASFGPDRRSRGVSDYGLYTVDSENVTIVTFSGYNRCGSATWAKNLRDFEDLFGPAMGAVRDVFPGKPLGLAEVASTPYCDVDLVAWYREMFMAAEAAGMVRIGLFFNPDPDNNEGEIPVRWDAILTNHPSEFRALVSEFQVSSVTPSPAVTEVASVETSVAEPQPPADAPEVDTVPTMSFRLDPAWSFPWQVNGSIGYSLLETENTGINPLTDEEFGGTGLLFQLRGEQAVLYDFGGGFTAGPSLTFTTVHSTNPDRFWDNYVAPGAKLGLYHEAPEWLADWGRVGLEVGVEQRFYTTDTPNRFNDGQETRAFVRGVWSFGGDWR